MEVVALPQAHIVLLDPSLPGRALPRVAIPRLIALKRVSVWIRQQAHTLAARWRDDEQADH